MPDDARKTQQVQMLAFQYADNAIPHFSAQFSDKPQLGELAMFSGMASATMLGTMYAVVHHNAGRDEADKWIMQYLSIVGTVVRSKQIPVLLTISAKSAELPKRDIDPVVPSNPLKLQKSCTCVLSGDGICPSCPPRLKTTFKDMIGMMMTFQKKTAELKKQNEGEHRCDVCAAAYLDASFASAILEGVIGKVSKKDAELYDSLFGFVLQMASMMGVQETPLTQAAWTKMIEQAEDGVETPGAK